MSRPAGPPKKRVAWWRHGKAVEVPGRGWGVRRHSAPPREYLVAGLATKGEAIKVLYAMASGWSGIRATFRDGRVLRVPLRETVTPGNVGRMT